MRILIFLLFLLPLSLIGQVESQFNGTLNVFSGSRIGSTNTFTISGIFNSTTTSYTSSQSDTGDIVQVQSGSRFYWMHIYGIASNAGGVITCNVRDSSSTLTVFPTGRWDIFRPTPNLRLPLSPDGTSNASRSSTFNTLALRVDNLQTSVASATNCEQTITKASHGFRKWTPIYWTGSTYVRPPYDSLVPDYIVVDSLTANTFKVANCGTYTTTLTNGLYWFTNQSPGYSLTADTTKVPLFQVLNGKLILNPIVGFNLTSSSGSGTGITDGDKGDITVSGSGTTWTIDNSVVTSSKIASQTVDSLDIKNGSITTVKIIDANVTLAKLATNSVDSTKAANLSPSDLAQTGANTNDVLTWTGTKYAPRTISVGGVSYVIQSTAPSDTTKFWLDNSSGATNIWELKMNLKGAWQNTGYYDPVGKRHSNLPPVYVAATGQSNMQGYLASGGDTTRSTRVVVWNGTTWRISTIGQLPYYPPADNNLAFQFCKNLAETENRIVRLVMEMAGGTEIEQWEGASKPRYDALETKITNSGMPRVDVILWHQGESNGDGLPSVCHDDDCYRTLLNSVIGQFRAESWGRNAIFIAGGLATSLPPTYEGRENVLEELSNDTLVYTGWVDSYGLTTNVDSVHFTGVAQQEFGRRYYNAYKSLPTLYGVRTIAQATDSTIINVTFFADTSSVTWTGIGATNSGSGTLTSGGTLPAGGNGTPTIDATRDFIYRIQWSASLATNDAAVIILDDSLNTNVTWTGGGSLAFPAGFYVGSGVLYGTVNNSSFLATGYSPTASHYARLTKSGNNILLQTSPDDATYTTRLTYTNALVGKTTLYPKIIFAASGAKIVKEATVFQDLQQGASQYLNFDDSKLYTGTGTPEGSLTAVVGSVFMREDGGAGTSFYVKESGSGNTGWKTAYVNSAPLVLPVGTATAGTAPLKFTSGTNLTTAETGAIEYDGIEFYATNSTASRTTLARVLKGSNTLDFGSTAAGAVTDLTITVTGAVDGDVVNLSVPNASQTTTGSFSAWVSATNTVTVRYRIAALIGSEDPASGVFKVTVTK